MPSLRVSCGFETSHSDKGLLSQHHLLLITITRSHTNGEGILWALSRYNPTFDRPFFFIEIHADFDDFFVSGLVLNCVALVIDLF